jgi:hypothetical protein
MLSHKNNPHARLIEKHKQLYLYILIRGDDDSTQNMLYHSKWKIYVLVLYRGNNALHTTSQSRPPFACQPKAI